MFDKLWTTYASGRAPAREAKQHKTSALRRRHINNAGKFSLWFVFLKITGGCRERCLRAGIDRQTGIHQACCQDFEPPGMGTRHYLLNKSLAKKAVFIRVSTAYYFVCNIECGV